MEWYNGYLMFIVQWLPDVHDIGSAGDNLPHLLGLLLVHHPAWMTNDHFLFSRFSSTSSKLSTHLDAPALQWGGEEGGWDIPRLLLSSPNASFLDICHLDRFMESGKIQLKICFFFDTDFSPRMRSKSHNPPQPLHLDQLHTHASKIMVLINSTFHFLSRALKTLL